LILLKLKGGVFLAFRDSPDRRCLLANHAMDGSPGDAITFRQLAKTLTLVAIAQDAMAIEVEWLTPDGTALELRPSHAGAHSLDDQVAFQLGDGSNNHYHRATQRAAGVDLFAEGDEFDVEAVQLVQSFKEVFHRSGDPVRGPAESHRNRE
jgi:hypothetical protein